MPLQRCSATGNIYDQDYKAARQLVEQGRTLASVQSFSKAEDWGDMEAYLNRRLGQLGEIPVTSGRFASDENQSSAEAQPEIFTMDTNYPNPFNPVTTIPFNIVEVGQVRIEVYDMLGRRVTVLADRMYEAGRHEVVWDASRMSSGIYLIRMVVSPDGGRQQQFNRSATLLK